MATNKKPRTNRGDPTDPNRKWYRVKTALTIREAEAKAGQKLTPTERAQIGRGRAYGQPSDYYSSKEIKQMNQDAKENARAKQGRINLTRVPRSGPGSGSSGSTSEGRYNRLTGGGLRDLDK